MVVVVDPAAAAPRVVVEVEVVVDAAAAAPRVEVEASLGPEPVSDERVSLDLPGRRAPRVAVEVVVDAAAAAPSSAAASKRLPPKRVGLLFSGRQQPPRLFQNVSRTFGWGFVASGNVAKNLERD